MRFANKYNYKCNLQIAGTDLEMKIYFIITGCLTHAAVTQPRVNLYDLGLSDPYLSQQQTCM